MVGVTNSLTHIASYKAYQGSYGGGTQDGFVAYFTTTGAEAWSSYYGGTATDYGQAVCFDAYQNIAIAGGTFSNNDLRQGVAKGRTGRGEPGFHTCRPC